MDSKGFCAKVESSTKESEESPLSAYTAIGDAVTDRRNDTTVFASTHEAGSSAIYTRDGGTVYLKDPEIHGWGEMTPQDLRNELGSKYGFCAAVLSNQKTSHVTLVNPKIVCHESSTANGAYAIFGGAVVIEGGTIDTCNRQGHGVDASYGGHVYCNGTKIHTGGMNSRDPRLPRHLHRRQVHHHRLQFQVRVQGLRGRDGGPLPGSHLPL